MRGKNGSKFVTSGLLLVLFTLTSCDRKDQTKPAPPPVKVTVVQPEEREVREYEELPGRVEAIERVEIRARVTGHLTKLHFVEGTEVKKGDPLISIDPREYQAQVDTATAALEQAQARLAQARSNYDRARQLSKSTVIARQELETQGTAVLDAAAGVRSAEANLTKARLNLEYTEIPAPISGKIGRVTVTEGNLVEDGDTLTSIVSQDPVYIYFDVPERAVLRWDKAIKEASREGLTARARIAAGLANEEGFPREGRVDFTDNELQTGTGTLSMRAVFPNEDRRLRPGLYARARVSLDQPQKALLVPERAVGIDQGQRFVYVVGADNKAEYRKVTVGQLYDGLRAIRGGLEPGERVVVEGLISVRPGTVVDAVPAETATPN